MPDVRTVSGGAATYESMEIRVGVAPTRARVAISRARWGNGSSERPRGLEPPRLPWQGSAGPDDRVERPRRIELRSLGWRPRV